MAMALSFGDFGVVALFGGSELRTLPYLLYERLGAYRLEEASAIGLVLMLAAFVLAYGSARWSPMLRVEACRVDYPDFAGRYSLAVAAGSLCAVVGPSGGGKTTLLHLIAGFETPVAGRAHLRGAGPPAPRRRRRGRSRWCSRTTTCSRTSPRRTMWASGSGLRCASTAPSASGSPKPCAAVDLAGCADRRPGEMSGGQRQRVALARALVTRKPAPPPRRALRRPSIRACGAA